MIPYIDIHSHKVKEKDTKYILVKDIGDPSDDHYFVNGIHPWDLTTNISKEKLLRFKGHPNYIGLGEIGLDKLKPNFNKQLQRFKHQLEILKETDINFIVLHNIKSTAEILESLKDIAYRGSLLLHAFKGSKEQFEQFNRRYNTYISCGAQILRSEKLLNTLDLIPKEKIFLETDDSDHSIVDIYNKYAEHNNIKHDHLKLQFSNNFTKLMKDINIHY